MDKRLIAERFTRARDTYTQEAHAQRQVAGHMLQLLMEQAAGSQCPKVVEMGCGTGIYSRLLARHLCPGELWLNDLCPQMKESIQDLLQAGPHIYFLPGDAESIPLPPEVNIITSCSTLQWFNRPDEFFKKCHDALATDGLLAVSTFGPQNLKEIRMLTGNGLDYPTLSELKEMLATHFHLLKAEEDTVTLCFNSPTEVLRHLKRTGITGTEKRIWTRGRLQAFCDGYTQHFKQDSGGVTLTYHPVYLMAQKKICD